MPTYRRRTRIDAPLSDVWEFHTQVDGLQRLTPGWVHLRVDGIDRPTTDPQSRATQSPTAQTHAELVAGTTLQLSVRPFGIGPRQRFVSRIRDRHHGSDRAYFVDDMPSGPLPEWVHTHLFLADGAGTILVDDIHYRLPADPITDPFGIVSTAGLTLAFRDRHRRTKRFLE